MSKEKEQGSTGKFQQSSHSNQVCRKIIKQTPIRRYDIVDLLIVSLYNSIIFGAGFGLGWLLWCGGVAQEVAHVNAAL